VVFAYDALAGHRIAWYPCAENLALQLGLCHNLKFLVEMLDEDRRTMQKADWPAIISRGWCFGSRSGRASRRRVVHRSSAGTTPSQHLPISHSTQPDSIPICHFVLGITGLIFSSGIQFIDYVVVKFRRRVADAEREPAQLWKHAIELAGPSFRF